MRLEPFPADFPHKGMFRAFDRSHNHVGYANERQYPGQAPVVFPEDATLFEINILRGYLREDVS